MELVQVDDIILSKLQTRTFELENTSSKMSLSAVFNDRRSTYMNELNLFIAHFNTIPNFVNEVDIDCKKVKINERLAVVIEMKDCEDAPLKAAKLVLQVSNLAGMHS